MADILAGGFILAMASFIVAVAAASTGSPHAQIGASRAKTFAAITEPVVLFGVFVVFTVGLITGADLPYALAETLLGSAAQIVRPAHLLATAALFMVILYETGRIPVETHTGTSARPARPHRHDRVRCVRQPPAPFPAALPAPARRTRRRAHRRSPRCLDLECRRRPAPGPAAPDGVDADDVRRAAARRSARIAELAGYYSRPDDAPPATSSGTATWPTAPSTRPCGCCRPRSPRPQRRRERRSTGGRRHH